MLHLSSLYQIDQGCNNWDVKMYRFWQFCMRFSVLIEFFFGFLVLDDFFYGFVVSNRPQSPPQYKYIQIDDWALYESNSFRKSSVCQCV